MKYIAEQDTNIKYTFQLGGGLKGRTVKKGEIVTVIGEHTNIDTPVVTCLETINSIVKSSFLQTFSPVDVDWICSECGERLSHNDLEYELGRVVSTAHEELITHNACGGNVMHFRITRPLFVHA